jgi:hypothetical protein
MSNHVLRGIVEGGPSSTCNGLLRNPTNTCKQMNVTGAWSGSLGRLFWWALYASETTYVTGTVYHL